MRFLMANFGAYVTASYFAQRGGTPAFWNVDTRHRPLGGGGFGEAQLQGASAEALMRFG
jgi:hypothetical protein